MGTGGELDGSAPVPLHRCGPGERYAGVPRLEPAHTVRRGQQSQAGAARQAEVQLGLRVEPGGTRQDRRTRAGLPHQAHVDHGKVMIMKNLRSMALLLVAAAAISGCERNAVQLIAGPVTGGASVKFFNFSVGSPAVNFYLNNVKATAVSSTSCYALSTLVDSLKTKCLSTGIESTTGTAYGSAGNGGSGWYSDVVPGQVTLQAKIATTTDKGVAISNLQTNVAAGKYYSYYMSGLYDGTAKTAESFIVEDVLPAVDYTAAYVRFVNASPNASPMTLWAKDRTTLLEPAVGGEVAYKAGGTFKGLPPGSYDLGGRYAGSATNTFSRTAVTISAGRIYTITARGNVLQTSTMLLDNTANW
ncbi:MAG: DUF4397 domain-containing protein [Gemmatimonadetes bacterium]|nr:DUF4397 domain-containing protein [Gemmatimonadota bacterium]